MTRAQLQKMYQEYLDDFDPTPDYAYDDYKTPMSFDEFSEELIPFYDDPTH
tara:strand:- start:102 stop:254 length:153 start_codon:yes stop_codon:yes gene_type:complete